MIPSIVRPGSIITCPTCGGGDLRRFYSLERVPVHSVILIPTVQEALDFPSAPLDLACCRRCGFVTNAAFDARLQDYSGKYEETQGFSNTFSAFHRRLAADLIERFDLRHKTIVEIGCGKGEFLALLCELGENRGIGFDPAYDPDRNTSPARDRMVVIRDYYSERYSHHQGDFYCCKMTLEHIHQTAEFVSTLRKAIGDRPEAAVFFQVPEGTRVLHDLAFWDIYYEHCSYFDRGSLRHLFERCGFEVMSTWTDYDDQYLMIAARPASAGSAPAIGGGPTPNRNGENGRSGEDPATRSDLPAEVERFTNAIGGRLLGWRALLDHFAAEGKRVVLWGGGSKAVAFLTTLGVRDTIEYAVDINPYKAGFFLAGTGQEVVSPSFLAGYRPDVVIIMNPIYRGEIGRSLAALGIDPRMIDVDLDPAEVVA